MITTILVIALGISVLINVAFWHHIAKGLKKTEANLKSDVGSVQADVSAAEADIKKL